MILWNEDGSCSLLCSSLVAPMEDMDVRREVYDWAGETFRQQRDDRLDVRRRAAEAADPRERARCRETVLSTPAPSYEACLRLSRDIRRKREVDFRSTTSG